MGKKRNKNTNLGRALINDRFRNKGYGMSKDPSMLHTAELADGYDWGRLNLQSVTEESSYKDFLYKADLAGTEFKAEKLNVTLIPKITYLPSDEEVNRILDLQNQFRDQIVIPRRPKWNKDTTAEELNENECKAFLDWRRNLALLQEEHNLQLTPYEKNLEFWRQLWRVLDRSDIIVQIVDSRNPLLFFCKDLENYALELDSSKHLLLLLNKADLLTQEQRIYWANYFDQQGIKAAFFSATLNWQNLLDNKAQSENDDINKDLNDPNHLNLENKLGDEKKECATSAFDELILNKINDINITEEPLQSNIYRNNPNILNRSELIALVKTLRPEISPLTVGLVGYPNVGKSSTINALMTEKKVSVSTQPGKTKHFQTLFLEENLILCDCPGLVMPSFVISKADMVISGILPIDHIRDHVPSVSLILRLIPRKILELQYGVMLPQPSENEDPLRPPTPEEFLNAFAYVRGFMTQNGQPDNARAARLILKDFVTGRLLHVYAPPGIKQEIFHQHIVPQGKKFVVPTAPARRALKSNVVTSDEVDKIIFHKKSEKHEKGRPAIQDLNNSSGFSKDHKYKRNKREKLRRVYSYLDQ